MCTLIALFQVHAEYPLIVAANRDELYRRRSSGPRLLRKTPRVIGGYDEEKGGTWLGASEHGFFVGLTNQRSFTLPDPRLRSRGEVVLSALGESEPRAAIALLNALDAREYNGFNLLVGNARALYVTYARPEKARIEVHALSAGVWTLPNDRLGSPDFPKVDRATSLARPLVALRWPELVERARTMLGDHTLPTKAQSVARSLPPWLDAADLECLDALCVHTPAYGTRSASLLAFSAQGLEHYLYADGPPCTSPLVPQVELVNALRRQD